MLTRLFGTSKVNEGQGQDSNENDDDEEPILYSLLEARTLVEISGIFLRACIESVNEVLTFIILECPSATVSQSLNLKFLDSGIHDKQQCCNLPNVINYITKKI